MTDTLSYFHVGIVVEDLDAARQRLTDLFGITWGPIQRMPAVDVRDGNGRDLALPSNICYSADEPRIELIEEVPGSVWVRNPYSNLHHIGFWTPTFDDDTSALTGGACPVQLCGRAGAAAPAMWAYHDVPDLGIRVEVLDDGLRDLMSYLFTPDASTP